MEASSAKVAAMAPIAPVGPKSRLATAHTPTTAAAFTSPMPTAAPPPGSILVKGAMRST